jgi:phosphohistidine phosphatase
MPLVLDLLRHGHADPPREGGDAARTLSPEGRRMVGELGVRLNRAGWQPDRVFASPLRRAQQSAEIVLAVLRTVPTIETLASLAPDREPEEVVRALEAKGIRFGTVLLVGHQPLLGRLVAHLVGHEHAFATGELVRVACESPLTRRSASIDPFPPAF